MATASEGPSSSNQSKKKVGRSPAYPGITIGAALAKAEALYKQEGKYPAPMAQALKAWGYSEKSSGGRDVRASMRYYGLISIEGDNDAGKVKLTPDALAVILDPREDQTEKKRLIRKLALNPTIHKKLVEKYPDGLASDGSVTHYLMMEEDFNPAAANQLLSQFKATATYAGIFKPDTVENNQEGDAGDGAGADPGGDKTSTVSPPPDGTKVRPPFPPAPAPSTGKVTIMASERVVFAEETNPQVYLKLVASGEFDELLLEALEDFVKRQKKRIKSAAESAAQPAPQPEPPAQ
jgi:hypothetical protein